MQLNYECLKPPRDILHSRSPPNSLASRLTSMLRLASEPPLEPVCVAHRDKLFMLLGREGWVYETGVLVGSD
jgi:hypothetical protein